jgi:hypothetical protein
MSHVEHNAETEAMLLLWVLGVVGNNYGAREDELSHLAKHLPNFAGKL